MRANNTPLPFAVREACLFWKPHGQMWARIMTTNLTGTSNRIAGNCWGVTCCGRWLSDMHKHLRYTRKKGNAW